MPYRYKKGTRWPRETLALAVPLNNYTWFLFFFSAPANEWTCSVIVVVVVVVDVVRVLRGCSFFRTKKKAPSLSPGDHSIRPIHRRRARESTAESPPEKSNGARKVRPSEGDQSARESARTVLNFPGQASPPSRPPLVFSLFSPPSEGETRKEKKEESGGGTGRGPREAVGWGGRGEGKFNFA